MRIPFLLIAVAVLGSRAWAQDDEKSPYYFQFGLGGVFSEDATDVPGGTVGFDPGYSVSAALGRAWEVSDRLDFDTEVEMLYEYFTVNEEDLPSIASAVNDNAKTFSFMLNGILDLHFTPQYSMYGGVGVGWAKDIQYDAWDSGSLSLSDNNAAAFQGLFGLAYNLGGTYQVRLGYRYFKTDTIDINDANTGSTSQLDVAQHSLEAAFRWML